MNYCKGKPTGRNSLGRPIFFAKNQKNRVRTVRYRLGGTPSILHGGVAMTDAQKIQIRNLRAEGFGYKRIAEQMGISENTIKTYCRRNGLGGKAATEEQADKHVCLYCGIEVKQNPGRKEKKFCSDKCRNKWWNEHLDRVNRKAMYEYECPHCKKSFTVYGNSHRKYCSHECYIADRFGGGSNE